MSSERKLDEPEVMSLCLNALNDLDYLDQCRVIRWLQTKVDQQQVARVRAMEEDDRRNNGGGTDPRNDH